VRDNRRQPSNSSHLAWLDGRRQPDAEPGRHRLRGVAGRHDGGGSGGGRRRRRRSGDGRRGRREGLAMADPGRLPRVHAEQVHAVRRRVSLRSSAAERRGAERSRHVLLRLHQGTDDNDYIINQHLHHPYRLLCLKGSIQKNTDINHEIQAYNSRINP